jgi:hypothetical protein
MRHILIAEWSVHPVGGDWTAKGIVAAKTRTGLEKAKAKTILRLIDNGTYNAEADELRWDVDGIGIPLHK